MDADMGTDTLFVHKDKAAASCRTPSASRPPTPTAYAAARRNHWDQRAVACDGVAGHIPLPDVAEGPWGARAGHGPWGDFGSGYAGLRNMRLNTVSCLQSGRLLRIQQPAGSGDSRETAGVGVSVGR